MTICNSAVYVVWNVRVNIEDELKEHNDYSSGEAKVDFDHFYVPLRQI
jgi:hypothetical protein